jgi:hypothetical protein
MLNILLVAALCCVASSFNVSLNLISLPGNGTSQKLLGQVDGYIWVGLPPTIYALVETSPEPIWLPFWTLSFGPFILSNQFTAFKLWTMVHWFVSGTIREANL